MEGSANIVPATIHPRAWSEQCDDTQRPIRSNPPRDCSVIFRGELMFDVPSSVATTVWLSMIHNVSLRPFFAACDDCGSGKKGKGTRAISLYAIECCPIQSQPTAAPVTSNLSSLNNSGTLNTTLRSGTIPTIPQNTVDVEEKVANGENIKCANCGYAPPPQPQQPQLYCRFVAYQCLEVCAEWQYVRT